MSSLNSQFINALSDADLPPPKGIVDFEGDVSEKRFAVYRNNVMVGLIDALKKTYPTILNLVGDEFFTGLAKTYSIKSPPKSPVLYLYGDGFSDFIANFEPLSDYPYMSDVAALEYSRVQAYHASDAAAVTGDHFQNFPQDQFGALRFKQHPACIIQQSVWPIVSILIANSMDAESASKAMAKIDMDKMEDALIVRPDYQVDVYSLQSGEYRFYKALFDGKTLDEAAALVFTNFEEFDLQSALSKALSLGLFSEIIS